MKANYQISMTEDELIGVANILETVIDTVVSNPLQSTQNLLSLLDKANDEEKEELKNFLLLVNVLAFNSEANYSVLSKMNEIKE